MSTLPLILQSKPQHLAVLSKIHCQSHGVQDVLLVFKPAEVAAGTQLVYGLAVRPSDFLMTDMRFKFTVGQNDDGVPVYSTPNTALFACQLATQSDITGHAANRPGE